MPFRDNRSEAICERIVGAVPGSWPNTDLKEYETIIEIKDSPLPGFEN
jgi:hypothetical protein